MDEEKESKISDEGFLLSKQSSIKSFTNKQKVILISSLSICLISLVTTFILMRQNDKYENQLRTLKSQTSNTTNQPETTSMNKSSETKTDPNITHSRVNICTAEGCLFIQERLNPTIGEGDVGTPEGFAKIKGYYLEYESTEFSSGSELIPINCDGFVITDGNETLISHFNDWIKQGNGLNKIIDDKLVTNVDFNKLSSAEVELIKSSSFNNQVELGVIRVTPRGMGASSCTPVTDIVSVKKIPSPQNL